MKHYVQNNVTRWGKVVGRKWTACYIKSLLLQHLWWLLHRCSEGCCGCKMNWAAANWVPYAMNSTEVHIPRRKLDVFGLFLVLANTGGGNGWDPGPVFIFSTINTRRGTQGLGTQGLETQGPENPRTEDPDWVLRAVLHCIAVTVKLYRQVLLELL